MQSLKYYKYKNRLVYSIAFQFKYARVIITTIIIMSFYWCSIGSADVTESDTVVFPFYNWAEESGDIEGSHLKPSLFTGGIEYSIPIEVPPGTGDMHPTLSISYHSSRKHGNAGKRWYLELPKIVRSTKYGVDKTQTWTPLNAVYVYRGHELIKGIEYEMDPFGQQAIPYYSEVEEYQKILYVPLSDYWVIIEKNGIIMTFGKYASTNNSRLRNGEETTFEYYLDEVRDTHNLCWRAFYICKGGYPVHLLHEIVYTYYEGVLLGEPRRVKINWGTRGDQHPEYVEYGYGFGQPYMYRIDNVVINLGSNQVRKYTLVYDANEFEEGEQYSPDSGSSMLYSITESGSIEPFGSSTKSLPPITFRYKYNTVHDPGFSFTPLIIPYPGNGLQHQESSPSTTVTNMDLIDLNGDGYKDIVFSLGDLYPDVSDTSPWYVYWGKGKNGFTSAKELWPGVEGIKIRRTVKETKNTQQGCETYWETDVQNEVIDMNADGLPDLYTGLYLYRNTGSGFEKIPWGWPSGTNEFHLRRYHKTVCRPWPSYSITELMDGNGDGYPDRFEIAHDENGIPYWKFFRNHNGIGFLDPTIWHWPDGTVPPDYLGCNKCIRTGIYSTCDYNESSLLDINGDGLMDFYWHEKKKFYIGTGQGFIEETHTTYATDFETIFGAEINIGKIKFWHDEFYDPPLLGVTGTSTFIFSNRYDYQYLGMLDMNGDGLLDLTVVFSDMTWGVWINTGTGIKSGMIHWAVSDNDYDQEYIQHSLWGYLPPGVGGGFAKNRLLDLDGSQTIDRVFWDSENWRIKLYQNRATVEPDLLINIDNNRGAATDLFYNTHLMQDDVQISSSVHFPVTLLSKMKRLSYWEGNIGTVYTDRFEYDEAFYDKHKREFRGFGSVNVFKSDDIPTHLFRREQHVFYNGDPNRVVMDSYTGEEFIDKSELAGKLLTLKSGPSFPKYLWPQRELWYHWITLDLFVDQSSTYGAAPLLSMHRVYDIQRHTETGVEINRKWREIAYNYDSYGNVKTLTDCGEVVKTAGGPDYSAGDDELTIEYMYSQNTANGNYIVSLPSAKSIFEGMDDSILLQKKLYYYDNFPTGEVEIGDLTEEKELVKYGDEPDVWTTINYTHDLYGNVTSVTNPEMDVAQFTYWEPEFIYKKISSVRIVKGKESGKAIVLKNKYWWDARYGMLKDVIDTNGRWLCYQYDCFGRIKEVRGTEPDTSVMEPLDPSHGILLEEFIYDDLAFPNSLSHRRFWGVGYEVGSVNWWFTDYLSTKYYYDGLGREIMQKSPMDSENGKWATVFREYDYDGNIAFETLPYESSTSKFDWIEGNGIISDTKIFGYDWAGREYMRYLYANCSGGDDQFYFYKTDYTLWSKEVENVEPSIKGKKQFIYDSHGRMQEIREKDDDVVMGTTFYTYDRLGNLISYQDPDGNITSMTYDSRSLLRTLLDGNLSNMKIATSQPRQYFYDLNGRLIRTIDAKGQQIDLLLDELGRVYLKDYVSDQDSLGINQDVVYEYDEGNAGLGRLSSRMRGSLSTSFTYDNWGRVTNEQKVFRGREYNSYMIYDLLDQIETLSVYPNRIKIEYVYDDRSRYLDKVHWENLNSNTQVSKDVIEKIEYDSMGRITRIVWDSSSKNVSRQQKWHRVRHLVRGELEVFSCMQEKT